MPISNPSISFYPVPSVLDYPGPCDLAWAIANADSAVLIVRYGAENAIYNGDFALLAGGGLSHFAEEFTTPNTTYLIDKSQENWTIRLPLAPRVTPPTPPPAIGHTAYMENVDGTTTGLRGVPNPWAFTIPTDVDIPSDAKPYVNCLRQQNIGGVSYYDGVLFYNEFLVQLASDLPAGVKLGVRSRIRALRYDNTGDAWMEQIYWVTLASDNGWKSHGMVYTVPPAVNGLKMLEYSLDILFVNESGAPYRYSGTPHQVIRSYSEATRVVTENHVQIKSIPLTGQARAELPYFQQQSPTDATFVLNESTNYYFILATATDGASGSTLAQRTEAGVTTNFKPPIVAPAALPIAIERAPYALQLVATPYSDIVWSISDGQIPDGMSFNTATGVLGGTPIHAGIYPISIDAKTTGYNLTTTAEYTLTVQVVKPKVDINHNVFFRVLNEDGTPAYNDDGTLFTNDPNPNDDGIEVFGRATVGFSVSPDDFTVTDARILGGGLDKPYQGIEEANNFWDLGYWDGKPYPLGGACVVYLPLTLLDRFSREEVLGVLQAKLPMGTLPLVRYYDAKTGEDSL
jgi:hypothetical protein